MTTLLNKHAQGIDEVRALEAALASTRPAPGTSEAVSTEFLERLQADAGRRRKQFKHDADLWRPVADQLLYVPGLQEAASPMKDDQRRRIETRRVSSPPAYTALPTTVWRFGPDHDFVSKAPPYDGGFTSGSGAAVNAAQGTFSLDVQAFGSSDSCSLSLGSWFFTPEDDPALRLSTSIQFSRDWHQQAMGYVAHSRFSTKLLIWDDTAKIALPDAPVAPGWDNGVSWFEKHGDHTENESINSDTHFPATAGHWYFCQVGFSASVDADSGIFGVADSTIHVTGFVSSLMTGSWF
ncbi:hypothetical protein [Streptomyces aureus]|jgi:hypothetical protein|uniref:Uncharacterized protein n=1 Tax=Streptomyces aureus TaxID=193461 RepID=A0ABV4SWW9_9ACTN